MNIVLNWEWPAVVMGKMTVARKVWTAKYARQAKKGKKAFIFDRHPSVTARKPQEIAKVRILTDAYMEPLNMIPDSDFEAGGWKFFSEHPCILHGILPLDASREAFDEWRKNNETVCVIRFQIISVNEVIKERFKRIIADKERQRLLDCPDDADISC